MLYRIVNNVAIGWQGEPINGVFYPLNIEDLWGENELNNIGLYKLVAADPVANTDTIVSSTISIVNGRPKTINTTRPLAPSDFPLTARQLRLGLIRNNVSLSTVQSVINGIPDPQTKDEYQVYWEYSTTINWEHPVTQALIAAVGITQANASIMWMIAKDYER